MRYPVICVALLLSGCVSPEMVKRQQDERDQFMANRPVCLSERQCEGMWAAARNWVTSTCGMKIQSITESFIETYNDVGGTGRLACRVTKDPRPEGGYVFTVTTGCGNMFGCIPDSWQAAKDFNHAVKLEGGRFATTPEEAPKYE